MWIFIVSEMFATLGEILHAYTMPSAKSDTPGTNICGFYLTADRTIPASVSTLSTFVLTSCPKELYVHRSRVSTDELFALL